VSVKFKYDGDSLQKMRGFEQLTRSRLKDFLETENKLIFIVQQGFLQKALGGKDKTNVIKLENAFKKKVKIIEHNSDVIRFTINVLSPLKVTDIKEDDSVITITGPDQKTKGLMIGARAANLRLSESIVQKYFPNIKELKVI
jgi:transcription termination/antitermination protein NusA